MYALIDFPQEGGGRLRGRLHDVQRVWQADASDQVPTVLAEVEAAARAGLWVAGFVAYEAAPAFDPALTTHPLPAGMPYAVFAAYQNCADLPAPVIRPAADASFFCKSWQLDAPEAGVHAAIQHIRQGIAEGAYYQVNLTARLQSDFEGVPSALFDALCEAQPAAYAAYLNWGEGQVLSVSPELFFARHGRTLTTRPMKGTAPRATDRQADLAAADGLRASLKERAENLMIVDLLRNDLARVARTGSVRVRDLFAVAPWATVWQMTSTVQAEAKPEITLADVFAALFPCGSVTGAPKVAAMQAIRSLESSPRGVYCGAIGVLQPGGDAVFSVGIRTVEVREGKAVCGIGSGITVDSTGAGEYAEWMAKRRFLFRASASFDLLETLRWTPDGGYWLLARHLDRLADSAAWFGFALNIADVEAALASHVHSGRFNAPQRVRLTVARDGRCEVRSSPFTLDQVTAPLPVVLAPQPVSSDDEFLAHKTTRRSVYEERAPQDPAVWDALLINERGELTEFTKGNLFIDRGGRRLTPALVSGLLPGVLRAELLARGEVEESVLTMAELLGADAVWFGNSVRGLMPVRLSGLPMNQD